LVKTIKYCLEDDPIFKKLFKLLDVPPEKSTEFIAAHYNVNELLQDFNDNIFLYDWLAVLTATYIATDPAHKDKYERFIAIFEEAYHTEREMTELFGNNNMSESKIYC